MNEKDFLERLKSTGRNDSCPCGSGKKYKKCHLPTDDEARHNLVLKQNEENEAKLASEKENEEDETDEKSKNTKSNTSKNTTFNKPKMNKKSAPKNIHRRTPT